MPDGPVRLHATGVIISLDPRADRTPGGRALEAPAGPEPKSESDLIVAPDPKIALNRTLYRVLLVEDNPADARIVREALAEHPAFTFQIAHFPEIDDALTFLEHNVVDVALLDYLSPDAVGLADLSRVVDAAPNLPIVMLTGLEDDATGLRMMQHGAQDYLVKGTATAAMLVRAIRQAIERKAMSDRVRDSEERFTLCAAGSGDGIWDWQIAGDRLYLSPRIVAMLGLPADETVGSMAAFARRIHLEDAARFSDAMTGHLNGASADFSQQARLMTPDGEARWVLVRGLAEAAGKDKHRRMAGSITDLSNLDAYYDAVTGLPNRIMLIDRLRGILRRRYDVSERHSAVMLVSLSRFAAITASLGQAAGDALVIGAARAIEAAARPTDIVARVSPREIAVVLNGIGSLDEAIAVSGRVCHALLAPILIEGQEVVPEARMGVVLTTPPFGNPEQVMRDAAAALDAVPEDAALPFSVFNPEMRALARERLQIERALGSAIASEAFTLAYQPVVALDGGALKGFEALLRWQDPKLGNVPPGVFVPIAEELGMIREIGAWVLRTACSQIVQWRAAGLIDAQSDFSVAVNLSGRQLADPAAIDQLMAIISESGVPPKHLTLELTETALVANPERAREALVAIKLLGISLAMDDFGTGYSSLSYLGRFPFDKLKIDRSFVSTIAGGVASPLLKGMLALTRQIGLVVVAEGVETKEQHDVLSALKCQDGQGWLFGRPMDAAAAERLLADSVRKSAPSGDGLIPATVVAPPTPAGSEGMAALDGVQRRLAVIVAADAVGFGRMLVHDEVAAAQAAQDMRRLFDPMIVAYRGRLIGVAGVSYMLEFVTPSDALSWALAVQRAMALRNAEEPEDRRLELRIGVNLGEITVRGHDVSGDGFNVAAGLEALAAPGGICASREIRDRVAGKIALTFVDLGAMQIKNSAAPVHVFRAEMPAFTATDA